MLRSLFWAALAATALRAADDLDTQMKSIIQAYSILEQHAADPISSEQAFYQGAIPGLLRHLDMAPAVELIHSGLLEPKREEGFNVVWGLYGAC